MLKVCRTPRPTACPEKDVVLEKLVERKKIDDKLRQTQTCSHSIYNEMHTGVHHVVRYFLLLFSYICMHRNTKRVTRYCKVPKWTLICLFKVFYLGYVHYLLLCTKHMSTLIVTQILANKIAVPTFHCYQ